MYVFSYKHEPLFCSTPNANNRAISYIIQSYGTDIGSYADRSHLGLCLTDHGRKELRRLEMPTFGSQSHNYGLL
jgi:hypothetical protein